jgi:hypothetical protein
MKKTLLISLSLITFGAFAQPGQAQNSNFENWSASQTYQTLEDWTTNNAQDPALATRSTDASNQTYSVKLQTVDIQGEATAGFVAYGNFNPNFGPTSYTSQVDSFVVDLKCNLMVGDTGTVAVIQFVNGNPQPIPNFVRVSGSQSSWTRVAFPLLSPSQDSIQIIISTDDLVMGTPSIVGSEMYVDNAFFKHATVTPAALPNNSFENWQIEEVIEPDFFNTTNALLQANDFEPNVIEVGSAQSGNSAAELSVLDLTFFQIPGIVTNGTIDGQGNISNGVAYAAQPDSMTGYFMANLGAPDDTCIIVVAFTENGNVIDQQQLLITEDVFSWTKFSLNFDLPIDPDSMLIVAITGEAGGTILTIDNFEFHGEDLGIEESKDLTISLYPNPAKDFITISSKSVIREVNIVDLAGNVVKTANANSTIKMINVSSLPAGVYLVEMTSGNTSKTEKLIIQ